jgi:hypothetical protein
MSALLLRPILLRAAPFPHRRLRPGAVIINELVSENDAVQMVDFVAQAFCQVRFRRKMNRLADSFKAFTTILPAF